jgi:hypothetical protein
LALPSAGSERERSAGRSGERDSELGERDSELGERDRELGERDSELGERDRELGERDSELGERDSGRGTLRVRGRRSLGQRAPVVGSESAGAPVGGRRSLAGR